MGVNKDSFLVGKSQYLEQGKVFSDTPEIMSKVVDNGYTAITTAKAKETEEKYQLWNNHPLVIPSFRPVIYKNPNIPTNPYDDPKDDFTTPIANYPTEVVLSNTVAHL